MLDERIPRSCVTCPPSCTPLMLQAARFRRMVHCRTRVAAIDPLEACRPFRVRSGLHAAVPNPSECNLPSSAAPKGAVRCAVRCGAVLCCAVQSVRPTQPNAGPSLYALVRTRSTHSARLRTARMIRPRSCRSAAERARRPQGHGDTGPPPAPRGSSGSGVLKGVLRVRGYSGRRRQPTDRPPPAVRFGLSLPVLTHSRMDAQVELLRRELSEAHVRSHAPERLLFGTQPALAPIRGGIFAWERCRAVLAKGLGPNRCGRSRMQIAP
jgi:hypothetical protein